MSGAVTKIRSSVRDSAILLQEALVLFVPSTIAQTTLRLVWMLRNPPGREDLRKA
jgi:hypothetical protein